VPFLDRSSIQVDDLPIYHEGDANLGGGGGQLTAE